MSYSYHGMRNIRLKDGPHPSHDMGEWGSDVFHAPGNDRFASSRECSRCGGAEVEAGGAGSRWVHGELLDPCPVQPEEET